MRIRRRRETELSHAGFVALLHRRRSADASFVAASATAKPKIYDEEEATQNAYMMCQLHAVSIGARFNQYITTILNEFSFRTVEEHKEAIEEWLAQYVDPTDNLEWTERCQRPLRDTNTEWKLHNGHASASVFLTPFM